MALRRMQLLCALTITGMEAEIRLETTRFHSVLIGYDMMSSAVVTILEVRTCAKSEVSLIDKSPKPKVDVQESISNAKVYCKQNPERIVTIVRCWTDFSSCFSQLQLRSRSRRCSGEKPKSLLERPRTSS